MSAVRPRAVPAERLERVLAPYKPDCRYLRRAELELPADGEGALVRLRGELSIPASCYIDDTGHFNSVEFNLCYNQLVYALMAECVADDLLPAFAPMTLEEYYARQLPDVLIHDFASRFRRPMRTDRFSGSVEILDARHRSRFLLVRTRCEFHDDGGGRSEGEVTLAVVDRPCAEEA